MIQAENPDRVAKNQDIEALRAYAILITVVAHLGDMVPSWNWWIGIFWLGGGVDLFFCISGFVITDSLVRQANRAGLGSFLGLAVPFWVRRVFRLWPAALLCSTVTLALAYGFNRSGAFGQPDEATVTAIFGLIQFVNLRLVLCANHYWLSCNSGDALWHYWSLSLEEQFYILFPIMWFVLPRRVLLGVAIVALLAQTFLERPWPSFLWFYRTDAILFGILIALSQTGSIFPRVRALVLRHRRVARSTSALAGVLLIVLATPTVVFFYHGLVAAVAACLVVFAAMDAGLVLPVLRWRDALGRVVN